MAVLAAAACGPLIAQTHYEYPLGFRTYFTSQALDQPTAIWCYKPFFFIPEANAEEFHISVADGGAGKIHFIDNKGNYAPLDLPAGSEPFGIEYPGLFTDNGRDMITMRSSSEVIVTNPADQMRHIARDPDGDVVYVAVSRPTGFLEFQGRIDRYSYGQPLPPLLSSYLQTPFGVACASDGTLYVSDTLRRSIYRVTPSGQESLFAGSGNGSGGTTDGVGTQARFGSPAGLAVDPQGNVYVADTEAHTIRRITPAGVVTTVAGLPNSPGFVDGEGAAARFNQPVDVAIDHEFGGLVVLDRGNRAIRVQTPAFNIPAVDLRVAQAASIPIEVKGIWIRASPAQGVPPGMVLNLSSMTLSGTPTQAGVFAMNINGDPSFTGHPGLASSRAFEVKKGFAAILQENDRLPYTGSPQAPILTTEPPGLALQVSSPAGATNVGLYPFTATVVDPNYEGSITTNFRIVKAPVGLTISSAPMPFDGLPKRPVVTVFPPELAASLRYSFASGPQAPTQPGTYVVDVTLDHPNYFGSAFGFFTITPATTATQWLIDHFSLAERGNPAISGDLADPDKDGWVNLLEYGLGTSPRAADHSSRPVLERRGSQLVFRYRRPVDREDLFYEVERSPNLQGGSWSAANVFHDWVSTEGDWETWEASVDATDASGFLRLRITRLPSS